LAGRQDAPRRCGLVPKNAEEQVARFEADSATRIGAKGAGDSRKIKRLEFLGGRAETSRRPRL